MEHEVAIRITVKEHHLLVTFYHKTSQPCEKVTLQFQYKMKSMLVITKQTATRKEI